MHSADLFGDFDAGKRTRLGPDAWVLRGYALPHETALLSALAAIEAAAPFRTLQTPGGFTMSAALSSCGALGWTSDRRGYRYSPTDPETGLAWPPMPEAFQQLAHAAAAAAGFGDFTPDACLINRYRPGARMSLHQDRNERDFSAPIVSVSLGMSATFLFGGMARSDRAARVPLHHGDVAVWGGADRLRYHGILPLGDHPHPHLGMLRINLTFRKAG